MEDQRIVELYWLREEAAIAATSEKYGSRLRSLALGITKDSTTAEECENDTYLRAWNAIPPSRPVQYLFAFLARITRNLSLDACRKRGRIKRSAFVVELSQELEQCIPAPDDTPAQVEAKLLGEAISRFLRTLPQEKREIFVRRYWYLDEITAIARRFDRTEGNVKTTLFRTRKALRLFLEQEGYTL